MDDALKHALAVHGSACDCDDKHAAYRELSDLEALRAENKRLREALGAVAAWLPDAARVPGVAAIAGLVRAALGEG